MSEKSESPNPSIQPFDDRKEHYESLITLFKYAVTSLVLIITLIGVFVGYTTYTDGKEMRAAMKDQENLLRQHSADLRIQELEMQKLIIDMIKTTREEVSSTGQRAINQIHDIREESTNIARQEAKKRIEQVFEESKIEDFIIQVAKDRIEPQVQKMVDDKILNLNEFKLERALSNLSSPNVTQQELSYLYFTHADPSEWTDSQLKNIINTLKEVDESTYLKGDICIYLALAESPIVENFFKQELVERPHGLIGKFAFNHLLKTSVPEDRILFMEAYLKFPLEDRPNFYHRLIQISLGFGNNSLALSFLNYKELVDVLFSDLKEPEKINNNSVASIRQSIATLFPQPSNSEYMNSYFYIKQP